MTNKKTCLNKGSCFKLLKYGNQQIDEHRNQYNYVNDQQNQRYDCSNLIWAIVYGVIFVI